MLKSLLTLIILTITTSCGFTPLYQQGNLANQQILSQLTQVNIPPISVTSQTKQSRNLASSLNNILKSTLNPSELEQTHKYNLIIKLVQTTDNVAIRKQGEPTRYRITISANYNLQDIQTKKSIDKGNIIASSSHDTTQSEFANFTASGTMIDNNAKQLAYELKLRLINFFINNTP